MPQVKLKAWLGLDGSGFSAGLTRAERGAQAFSRRIAGYFAGMFTIGAITAAAKRTIEWGGATDDLAKSIGITAEQLQELEYAAKKSGTNIGAIANAFRRLSTFRNEALTDPTGKSAKLAEALGIGPEEMRSLDTPLKLFERFAEIFRTKNLGAAQGGIAQDIFGRSAMQLLPMFIDGLQTMREEARTFGVVVKDDVVASLAEMGDLQDRIIQQLREPWADALVTLYGWLLKMVKESKNLLDILVQIPQAIEEEKMFSKAHKAAKEAASFVYHAKGSPEEGPLTNVDRALLMYIGTFANSLKKSTKNIYDVIGERAGDVIAERNIADEAREIADAIAKAKAEANRKDAGEDVLRDLAASKSAAFKPPTDALARIGGFVGRGNVPAENWQRKTAENTKRVADRLERGIKLEDQL